VVQRKGSLFLIVKKMQGFDSKDTTCCYLDHGRFQAIILAIDEYSELYPFTPAIPKCLLPMGNRKLIDYPIHLLKSIRPSKIFLLVHSDREATISEYIRQKYQDHDCPIEVHGVPCGAQTAEALLQLYEGGAITKDFILLPCDVVCDFPIEDMTYIHFAHDSSMVLMLKEQTSDSKSSKKAKRTSTPGTHVVGLLDHQDRRAIVPAQRLLYLRSLRDYSPEDPIVVNKALLKRFPELVLDVMFENMMVAVCQHWVLEILDMKMRYTETSGSQIFKSLDLHFLPYLVDRQITRNVEILQMIPQQPQSRANQMSSSSAHACPGLRPPKPPREPEEADWPEEFIEAISGVGNMPRPLWINEVTTETLKGIAVKCGGKTPGALKNMQRELGSEFNMTVELEREIVKYFCAVYNARLREQQDENVFDKIRVYAYMPQVKNIYRLKDDTNVQGKSYLDINNMILSGCKNPTSNWPKVETENLQPLRNKFPGAIIGNMNLVGSNCSLGTKAVLKRSTIGNFCKIADRVKIIGCVLMDHVTIEAGSSLINCVVGAHCVVGADCNLNQVLVEQETNLQPELKQENDIIFKHICYDGDGEAEGSDDSLFA